MTYVDDIAEAIKREVAPNLLPGGDTDPLFRTYAVLAMAKGEGVELDDVHNAWSAWMSAQDPHHKSLKPLNELGDDVQAADLPYLDAIRRVARSRQLVSE